MLTYYLVIQDTGVLYFQAISQAGGWLLEVGEYQWNEEKKLVAEWRNLLSLGWSPPVGEQAPNYHLYLKDYSGPNGIEERVIQAYEVAFGFTLSELASFALETRGSGYVSSGS